MADGGEGMYHVTVTVAGAPVEATALRASLERLSHQQPFLTSMRYAPDRVELRYWEQAACVEDAAALGLRLWGEHRTSAGLPPWTVVGLEVVDRTTYQRRAGASPAVTTVTAAGQLLPF